MSSQTQATTVFQFTQTSTVSVKREKVPKASPVRRVVVIDGCNVISKCSDRSYSIHTSNNKFNALPILLMVHDLIKRKFEVFVTIKEFFMSPKTVNYVFALEQLRAFEVLHVFPDAVDDDRIILNTAKAYKGSIISNDKFRDRDDGEFGAEKARRMGFRYDADPNYFPNVDNAGKPESKFLFGLKFDYPDLNTKGLCFPGDPDYNEVKKIYDTVGELYLKRIMSITDLMASYIQREQCYALKVRCPPAPFLLPNDMPDFYLYLQKRQSYEARTGWDKK
uniref:RNase_Zc3h12a domain-containing protein n=2 Tax=Bursaphelenchus xylophilus TaxID=6326 RepID=A0A1I7RJA2_BURXY